MATAKKNGQESGMVGKLAGKGEEALTRIMDELGRNPRVTDALGRAMSAKGKLDDASRGALGQIGLAASDEIRELRDRVETLERRLASLEKDSGRTTSAKRTETKKTPTTATKKKRSSASAKKKAEETSSPSAGRAIGGGAGRGSSAGGGNAAA